MVAWSSSLDLLVTRSWSPWMEAWTLSLESLTARAMAFAFSDSIPCFILTGWRTVPFSAGSIFW